jgi:hypothetical protein
MHYMARASAARQIAGGGSGCTACRAIDHSHSSCTGTTVLRLECACAYAWARELDHTAETSVTAECQSPLLSANLTVGEHACACGGRPTRWTSSRPAREGFLAWTKLCRTGPGRGQYIYSGMTGPRGTRSISDRYLSMFSKQVGSWIDIDRYLALWPPFAAKIQPRFSQICESYCDLSPVRRFYYENFSFVMK